jgi:hypothetical protein
LETVIAILDVVRKLDGRELAIEDRDDYNVCLPAHGLTEVVFRVEVARHPSTAMVPNDHRPQSRVRIRGGRMVDADGNVGGNLLVA